MIIFLKIYNKIKISMSFSCKDCGREIPGTDCAYTLSRIMGWKHRPGCYAHCPCGYPIRAKEVKNNIFADYLDSDKNSSINAYIYCENNGGHVYYGTYDECVRGNGYTASNMSPCQKFERYASYN